MGKLATRLRVGEQSKKSKENYLDKVGALYDQISSQRDIIADAGKGSRRANSAQKKIDSFRKKISKLREKKEHTTSRVLKDYDLVKEYGESAMEPKGFGTDRGVDYTYEYDPSTQDVHLKDPPIKRTHEVDRKKGKGPKPKRKQGVLLKTPMAKGGYVKKYASGGGVRKARW